MPLLAILIGAIWVGASAWAWWHAQGPAVLDGRSKSDAKPGQAWLLAWYNAAHSDIQWTKLRSWETVRWVLLLQLAITTIARSHLIGTIAGGYYIAAQLALLGVSYFYLYRLHAFAAKARSIADLILAAIPGAENFLPEPEAADRHHVWILASKYFAVGLGTLVSAAATLSQDQFLVDLCRTLANPVLRGPH